MGGSCTRWRSEPGSAARGSLGVELQRGPGSLPGSFEASSRSLSPWREESERPPTYYPNTVNYYDDHDHDYDYYYYNDDDYYEYYNYYYNYFTATILLLYYY